ncbi:MAG: hexosaminidase [Candidatus Azotimanducaceae bacterium]|jgi:hexosaminidase
MAELNSSMTIMKPVIYPEPAFFHIGREFLDRADRIFIQLTTSHSDNFAERLQAFASAQIRPLELTYGAIPVNQVLIKVRLKGSAAAAEQYDISTSQAGYLLSAPSECGLYRGLCTLTQLLNQSSSKTPFVTIRDKPDFAQRGVMLDISRCKVPTIETLKALIESFAELKYNQLQLYTEHTFRFFQHPLVWANASPLSAADILELKQFAAARYIDLVPNLNCFGHFERWLRHPEYRKYAECPAGFRHPLSGQDIPFGSTLTPVKSSLKLIDSLHAEYLPLFDSPYFNVGGDEPWELGLGRSRKKCEKSSTTDVYIDFMSDIQRLVEKRDRQMMFWSDIVLKEPKSLKRLSTKLIALNWGYEANHPFRRESAHVADQGIPFYVCPGTSSWNSLTGRTDNMRRNIASAAKHGKAYGAEGLLLTDWGDHGHHQYLPMSYPGYAVGACESWRQGSSARIDLPHLINQSFLKESNTNAAKTIVRLGKVLELARSPLRNATIFNRLLFWNMNHEPSVTSHLSSEELGTCKDEFRDLLALPPAESPLLTAEIGNAINMAMHGLDKLRYFRGEAVPKQRLRAEMMTIKAEHERLWLARNRPGGLQESLSHLDQAAEALSKV